MVLLFVLALIVGCASTAPSKRSAPFNEATQRPRLYSRETAHKDIESFSVYVEMSDGVKLAVDVHLPKGPAPGQRIPTILHQTRYWRSLDIRFPGNLFADGYFLIGGRTKKYFVHRGYAWVNVDVRGTGASFGRWKHSYWDKEVRDGAEIVDWIVRQSWSDGNVGSWGKSYAGGAAEFLLVNQHPNVKAAVPMYSPFDVYDDIGWPGGIFSSWYVAEWAALNEQLDKNNLPVHSLRAKLFLRGVKPVDGDGGRRLLREAIEQHTENTNVAREALGCVFRNDSSPNIASTDAFSPHAFSVAIRNSGTPIYSYSGWYDGAYQHAAIKRFLTYDRPGDRLMLGPWDHGGHHNSSPFVLKDATFDHHAELLKFFDHHLVGIDTGLEHEARVHYYTMGAEEWRATDTWPPSESRPMVYYMGSENTLASSAPDQLSDFDEHEVDFDLGAGTPSRWTALVGPLDSPAIYPDWNTHANARLHYMSSPLDKALEVTGHPLITIYVSSTATDGNFFAYLEDVDTDGDVTYVTEGMLRALHRASVSESPPYRDVVPVRIYDRKSGKPLVPGEIVELTFDLLPISYLFKPGHSIRLSIAGSDKDHFPDSRRVASVVRVFRDANHPSRIVLPTMPSSVMSH